MCRTRVRSVVVAVATLRVVLIAAAAAAVVAANSAFTDDFYPGQNVLIIDPQSVPKIVWSRNMPREKRQKFNDPSLGIVPTAHGYRRAYGDPWMLFKHPAGKLAGLAKQSPSQSPYERFNADEKTVSENFGGYGRRSASEMSSAEEEYQAVRRALARDRVQPMRRSMVPTMGMMPKAGRKREDKTVEELLPLVMKLASLIDKLDRLNGAVKNDGEDGEGKTKRSVVLLLKDLINGLQNEVENKAKIAKEKSREYTRRGNVDDSGKLNHPDISASIGVDRLEGETKNEFPSFTKSLKPPHEPKNNQNESKRVAEATKASSTSWITVPPIEDLNPTDQSDKPEFRTGLNNPELHDAQSSMDAAKVNERNADASVVDFSFDTPSGLVPEHRAFDNVAIEGQEFSEDADTSVELVNRAFDDVIPS